MKDVIFVSCSRCGRRVEIPATQSEAENLIQHGWSRFGTATYCPECSASWCERNPGKPLPAGRESILSAWGIV